MGKLLLVILIVLAVVVVTAVMLQGRQYAAFMEKAQKTSGHITRKEVRNFRPNQQTGKENWVSYEYALDGKSYSGEEKVEYADLWHGLNEGQETEIYYNRENPGESHVAAVLDKRLGIAETVLGKAAK